MFGLSMYNSRGIYTVGRTKEATSRGRFQLLDSKSMPTCVRVPVEQDKLLYWILVLF